MAKLTLRHSKSIIFKNIFPEYFFMMFEAFESIAPDRICFNITSGDIQYDENSIEDLVAINDFMRTPEQRGHYTELWLKKAQYECPRRADPYCVPIQPILK